MRETVSKFCDRLGYDPKKKYDVDEINSAYEAGRKAERERMMGFARWTCYSIDADGFGTMLEAYAYWKENVEGK